jgi:hypothetical protein
MSDKSRRKLLKSIAAGSGAVVAGKSLPDSWVRPVVDSVLLPAHALTSNQIYSTNNVLIGMNGQTTGGDTLLAGLVNSILPPAEAGTGGGGPVIPTAVGCATIVGSMLEFEILVLSRNDYRVTGMLPLNKQVALVTLEECGETFPEAMQILDISPTEVTIVFVDGPPSFTLPAAPVCVNVPPLEC